MASASSQPSSDSLIVVGFDGSEASGRGLDRAAQIAAAAGGSLIVVAVDVELSSSGITSEPLIEDGETAAALLEQASQRLAGHGSVAAEFVPGRGDPAVVLMDTARNENAGLIVVGRRGRSFEARMLLGSVAARIVEQSPCDVLVAV